MMGQSEGSMFSQLRQRELNGGLVDFRPFVRDFSCEGNLSGTIVSNASTTRRARVFCLEYGARYNKFLAVGDDDGYVSIIDAAKTPPSGLDDGSSSRRPVAQWTAHGDGRLNVINAVRDIAWTNNDLWMYTASGNSTIALWDTSYAYKIACFYDYEPVKTISVSPTASEILASGNGGGEISIWDVRVHPAKKIESAFGTNDAVADRQPVLTLFPVTSKYRWYTERSPSVTAVKFLDFGSGHTLASGSVDGVVRFWDVRYAIKPTSTVYVPNQNVNVSMSRSIQETNKNARIVHLADTPIQDLGKRTYAVNSLEIRPCSSQLLVSLKRGHHMLYDVDRPEIGPVKWFGGHTVSSFHVKASFSPDGSHFASGSSDNRVCIWQVDDADGCAPYELHGHERGVTAVTWCPTDFGQLATTSDDCTIKLWNMNRKQEMERKDPPRGWISRAEILLAAKPKNLVPAPEEAETQGEQQQQLRGGENNTSTIDNGTVMMINRNLENPVEAGTPQGTCFALASSRLATTGTTLAGGTGRREGAPGTNTGSRIRIANALRVSLMHKPKMKRTKQQTLAEALHAAHAAQVAREEKEAVAGESKQQEQQRRPRSAGTSTSDEENAPPCPQNEPKHSGDSAGGGADGVGGDERLNITKSPSKNENHPMNI